MKLKYNGTDALRLAKNLILVVFGTLVLAFGTAVFLLPFNLIAGGVSGMALVIKQLIPYEKISIDVIVTVITWLFFFMGLLILGKGFAMKTFVSTLVYPLALSLFLRLVDPSVMGGFFYLAGSEHSEISLILASSVGGVFVGAGCALTFLGGGSTGGVDILAFTICKIFRRLKSSVVIFCIDASIVLLGMFVIGDMVISLLGILSALIAAVMVDKVFLGGSRAFIAHIITDKYEEMNLAVIEKLERTTTIFDAVGGYSGEGKKMLMVSFTMSQYADLMTIVKRIDKYAFMTVHNAHEINGEGWTR